MHVIFKTIIISSIIITASAIECYSCESVYESSCGEDFDSEEHFKVDCDQKEPPRYIQNEVATLNATACMKRIFKERAVTKFLRSCYFGDVNDTNIGCRMDPSIMDIKDVQCFVCDDDDYCNTASWSRKDWWSTICSMSMLFVVAKILNLQCV